MIDRSTHAWSDTLQKYIGEFTDWGSAEGCKKDFGLSEDECIKMLNQTVRDLIDDHGIEEQEAGRIIFEMWCNGENPRHMAADEIMENKGVC